jgi:hypothetical protein
MAALRTPVWRTPAEHRDRGLAVVVLAVQRPPPSSLFVGFGSALLAAH